MEGFLRRFQNSRWEQPFWHLTACAQSYFQRGTQSMHQNLEKLLCFNFPKIAKIVSGRVNEMNIIVMRASIIKAGANTSKLLISTCFPMFTFHNNRPKQWAAVKLLGSINLANLQKCVWHQETQTSTTARRTAGDISNVTEVAAPPPSKFAICGTKNIFASPLISIQYCGPRFVPSIDTISFCSTIPGHPASWLRSA